MEKKELIKEHKHLVDVLRNGSEVQRKIEANKQARELKEMNGRKKLEKAFKKK